LSGSTNAARIESGSSWGIKCQNSHGYIQIGPANASWAHIYTDRGNFYFNKDLYVNNQKVWHNGYRSYNNLTDKPTIPSGNIATHETDGFFGLVRQEYYNRTGYWGGDNEYEGSWHRVGNLVTITFLINFDNSGGIGAGGYHGFSGLPYTPLFTYGRPVGTYGRMTRTIADPHLVTIQSDKLYIWGGPSGLASNSDRLEGTISYIASIA
jgi:hypothetical protein